MQTRSRPSSKSPAKRPPSPSQSAPGLKQFNYAERLMLLKEIDYWKLKHSELEEFCRGKSSYLKLQSELEIWKSKYQQLAVRARVAKGSELIIQEYQTRIAELSSQLTHDAETKSPQQQIDGYIKQDLIEQVEKQQEQITLLANQIEDLKKQKLEAEANQKKTPRDQLSNVEKLTTQKRQLELDVKGLHEELARLRQDLEGVHDFYQNQLREKDYQLEQEKLKLQILRQDSQVSLATNADKLQSEISLLKEKLKDHDRQKQYELANKDEHYQRIIAQLKQQIQNQIQSGEMRLSTLQSILKEQSKSGYKEIKQSQNSKHSEFDYSYQNLDDFRDMKGVTFKSTESLGFQKQF